MSPMHTVGAPAYRARIRCKNLLTESDLLQLRVMCEDVLPCVNDFQVSPPDDMKRLKSSEWPTHCSLMLAKPR